MWSGKRDAHRHEGGDGRYGLQIQQRAEKLEEVSVQLDLLRLTNFMRNCSFPRCDFL
jgi:hypothetical protein